MPRGPRLEAPGSLHHVMVRGIERTAIFRDRRDRADSLERLAAQVTRHALTVYAWALLPNHAHLLLRTGAVPLARPMQALLRGYAGAFNRRHRRAGHLFQNRYKAILVEPRSRGSCAPPCGGGADRVPTAPDSRNRPAAFFRFLGTSPITFQARVFGSICAPVV